MLTMVIMEVVVVEVMAAMRTTAMDGPTTHVRCSLTVSLIICRLMVEIVSDVSTVVGKWV